MENWTPDSILEFWLGPLKTVGDATEDNWRDRMLRWRVGVFARGFEDAAFRDAQRVACERLHRLGQDGFFSPREDWETPRGTLAKIIVLDQFPRCVYRGTPLAYAHDAQTPGILEEVCRKGWDIDEYNEVERMWVYVSMSHPENQKMQEMSVDKWTQWSRDLVDASPPELRRLSQHVSWYFIKSIVEHSEAVLLHGHFPHRNAIMSRPHQASELYYLTSEMRPLWSYTQPPRPDYYALHGAFHACAEGADCKSIGRKELDTFHRSMGIDPNDAVASLSDVFSVLGKDRVDIDDVFRHAMQSDKLPALHAVTRSESVQDRVRRVKRAIFRDENATWPPASGKASVPRVIDVPALNAAISCPYLRNGDVSIPRSAIDAFVGETAFEPCPLTELSALHRATLAERAVEVKATPGGFRTSNAITRRDFKALAKKMFGPGKRQDDMASKLYALIDLDYSGSIDASELLVALSIVCRGSVVEKVNACFDIFDADGSGHLDQGELKRLVHATLLRGFHLVEALFAEFVPKDAVESGGGEHVVLFSVANYTEIEAAAERALAEADRDGDGFVDRAEFIQWAQEHPLLRQFFQLSDVLFPR